MRAVARASFYILKHLIPSFTTGTLIFVGVLLTFQLLRLTEFVIVHDIPIKVVLNIVVFLSVSFLPVILPMSLLFSVLLTFSRLSSDAEIVAFKSIGISPLQLSLAPLCLAAVVGWVSSQISFEFAPWGNRQFELIVSKAANFKAGVEIQEGAFTESLFDMVIYANKVHAKKGLLEKVFIYDERDEDMPVTIIAQKGILVPIKQDDNPSVYRALIRLFSGNIHRTSTESYTKIDFESYDIYLNTPYLYGDRAKSVLSFSGEEIQEELLKPEMTKEKRLALTAELYKRWALAVGCLFFVMMGIGLGTRANQRSPRAAGMMISLIIVVAYWTIYIVGESLARSGAIPVWVGAWSGNMICAWVGIYSMRRALK